MWRLTLPARGLTRTDEEIRATIAAAGGTPEDFIRFLIDKMMEMEKTMAEADKILAAANTIIGNQNRAIARAHTLLLGSHIDGAITLLLDAIKPEPRR